MSDWREGVAEILEAVARDGLPEPRSLDVALDAIGCEVEAALATARREGMEAVNALAMLEFWAKKGKVEIARSLLGKGFEVGHLTTNSVGVGDTIAAAIRAAKEGK